MKEKQVWMDNTRVLATISVIILHASSPILNNYGEISEETWLTGNFYDGLVRFCVPIFFMLTGALLLSKDYTLRDFLRKRFLRIIPPLIFWSFIYLIYDNFLIAEKSFSLIEFVQKVIRNLFYGGKFHLWFIYTLLWALFIHPNFKEMG